MGFWDFTKKKIKPAPIVLGLVVVPTRGFAPAESARTRRRLGYRERRVIPSKSGSRTQETKETMERSMSSVSSCSQDNDTTGLSDRELLILERQRTNALEQEVKSLKEALVQMGESTEMEEERITNRLIKRLHELKQEKEKLALEVEREEELLTNSLQKKLNQLRNEKVDLENRLENEQEYIVNKLHKQLAAAKSEKERLLEELSSEDTTVRKALETQVAQILHEKVHLENELEQEQEFLVNRLQKQLAGMQNEKRRMERKVAKENVLLFESLHAKLDTLRLSCGDNVNALADGISKLVLKVTEQQRKKAQELTKPLAKDDLSITSWASSVSKDQMIPEAFHYQHIRRGTM